MKLIVCLAVCCFALTDGQIQNQYNIGSNSSGRIYFEDNRPEPQNTNRENKQRIYRDDGPPGSNVTKPSIELQPPHVGKVVANSDVTRNRDRINLGNVTRTPIVTKFDNVSLSVTNFAVNLIKTINELQRGNTVVSPFSIVTLLGLLQQGAAGTTLDQISQALQMSPEMSAAFNQKLNENLQNRSSRNVLKTANGLFIADAFSINPQFKAIAQTNFGSEVTPMNFGIPLQASQQVNNWVASKTNNKIERLLSPDALDINTQIVLVNTVYFKGLWEVKFRPDATALREFHLTNGDVQMKKFMRMRRYFRTGVDRTNGAQVISLPFEYNEYSLMVILPAKSSSVSALVATLTNTQLANYHRFPAKEVLLDLPKFTIRADTDMSLVFQKMGITNIFSQYAELFGLGIYRTFSPQISSAVHSAMISIDEEGGSAAAATAFAVVTLSFDDPSEIFNANRPFLAILWDNAAALPLFVAKIENPS